MSKLISIVIPIFNEEKNISPLFAELKKSIQKIPYDFEIIFVNDGSRDGSILALEKLAQEDPQVKVIDFARNFGKEVALTAGCQHSQGQAVITMDADLQHPPEIIPQFIDKWQQGFEVVYTVRNENKGASLTKKLTSKIYWWLFSKISSVNTEPHSTDFRLMDKKVIDIFRNFSERGRIFRGIIDWIGFKRTKIAFTAPERREGMATYSYQKLIGLAINSLTAFSLLPLRIAGYMGMAITLISFIVFSIMFLAKIFGFLIITSIAFVIVANTFLIGIVLICLGFIALYIARIHDEVINRPLYIVREKINFQENERPTENN